MTLGTVSELSVQGERMTVHCTESMNESVPACTERPNDCTLYKEYK